VSENTPPGNAETHRELSREEKGEVIAARRRVFVFFQTGRGFVPSAGWAACATIKEVVKRLDTGVPAFAENREMLRKIAGREWAIMAISDEI
jgi:hypothetical protein